MNTTVRLTSSLGSLLSFLLLLGSGRPVAAQTTYTPYQFITIAGTAGSAGSADGAGSAARFSLPNGIAVDGSGNVFIADGDNDTIREMTPGGMVTTIAGSPGVAGVGVAGGVAASTTRFHYPTGVAVDTDGDFILVADTQNSQWQGLVKSVSGGVTTWLTTNLGPLYLETPIGVAVGPNGSYGYATGISFGSSSKMAVNGAVILVEGFSGSFTPAFVSGSLTAEGSTNGTANAASFNDPAGIALDTSGDLYIADNGNDLVRVYTPMSGTPAVVTTLAGTAGIAGSADGTGTAAQFNALSSVAVDANGNVYVADTNNDTIRKITPAGVVTTLAGVPGVAGSADGTGSAALFNKPYGIAVDASGNLYVTDSGNNTIRKGLAPSIAPTFTVAASPSTATVATGRTAVFNATATGTPAPAYQWKLNGSTTIPGAAVTNDPILMINGATAADVGTLTCTATNSAGSATTSATLAVTTTANPGYLTNLSGRGVVGVGAANAVIGGFVISGSAPKQLLIRGMGPGLNTYFGLPGYLTATQLTLFNTAQAAIYQNTTWGGTAALIAAQATLGAYTVPTTSLDSMLYPPPVAPAAYSTGVSGVGTATGVAAVEVYDADTPPLASKLVNVSVRVPVGTGGNILVGGFEIGGTTAETVLIRGLGPGLTYKFGLTGTLAQPVLTLFQGLTPIYSNTVWGGDPVLISAEGTVGGYGIQSGSADSLLLVTLPPGGYTAQISGANNTTGIAAVEIYELQ